MSMSGMKTGFLYLRCEVDDCGEMLDISDAYDGYFNVREYAHPSRGWYVTIDGYADLPEGWRLADHRIVCPAHQGQPE